MIIGQFLEQLHASGVKVWAEGEVLRCNAPKGLLTPELQSELKVRKAEILAFLRAGVANNSSLVPIQPKGARPPFIGIPGHNGDIFCYVLLAQYLGDDQPFYGLQPPGVNGETAPLKTVSELASHYVRQLRTFLPDGPYLLGGYCAGGAVAFDVARQLTALGATVDLLVLFQSPFPSAYSASYKIPATCRYFARRIPHHIRKLVKLDWHTKLRYLRDRVRGVEEFIRERRAAPSTDQANAWKARVAEVTVGAVQQYRPAMFPGSIHLYMSSQEAVEHDYGRTRMWARYAERGLQPYIGPDGCTGATMLREPFVKAFADHLRAAIDKELIGRRVESHCCS